MKIGITARPGLEGSIPLTEKIINHLNEKEVKTFLSPELGSALDLEGTPVNEMPVDCLITLGGDGTVLRNVHELPETPILGINLGGRGFLADVSPENSLEAIDKLIEDDLKTYERTKLSVKINGKKIGDALNEGVVRLKDPSTMIKSKVIMDGEEVEKLVGDGIIISTPTGSTAYALSAGGPVMDPKIDAFLAVPLATHRPKALPLVFSMDSKLELEILEPEKEVYITLDGQMTEQAQNVKKITFEKSENSAKFYKWKSKFYEKIKEKL